MTADHEAVTEEGVELSGLLMDAVKRWQRDRCKGDVIDARVISVAFGGALGAYLYAMKDDAMKRTVVRGFVEQFLAYAGMDHLFRIASKS